MKSKELLSLIESVEQGEATSYKHLGREFIVWKTEGGFAFKIPGWGESGKVYDSEGAALVAANQVIQGMVDGNEIEASKDGLMAKVIALWSRGKSLSEIENEIGMKVDVEGSIADQHKNIMGGRFKLVAPEVHTTAQPGGSKVAEIERLTRAMESKIPKARALLNMVAEVNTGGLPLAGRVFLTTSGQKIKVKSQDLRHVRYVNLGADDKQESEEFAYPLKDFDMWVAQELFGQLNLSSPWSGGDSATVAAKDGR